MGEEREREGLEAEGKRKRKGGSDVCIYLKGAAVSKRNKEIRGKKKFSILSRRIIYSFPLLLPILFFFSLLELLIYFSLL